jgi:hypothetical protein
MFSEVTEAIQNNRIWMYVAAGTQLHELAIEPESRRKNHLFFLGDLPARQI